MLKKKIWIPILIVLLAVIGCGLFYRQQVSKQEPVKVYKVSEVEKPETPKPPPPGETAESGHWHGDEWHAEPHTQPPPIEPPEDDPFFASIVFPDTPPHRPGGHYRPKKSAFPVEDVIRNNPHLFRIGEDGIWDPIYSPEKSRKLEQLSGVGLTEEAFDKKIVEILTEGLDPLPAALFVMSKGLVRHKAKPLIDKALAENPDDFDTLYYWCGMNKREKPAEAEAGYRRLVEMRPESMAALFGLGRIIVDTHPEPREAIPYLEKVYRLNPSWHGAIFVLGRAYLGLGQLEKALKYFQASEAFTGPTGMTSLYIPFIKWKLAEMETQGDMK